MEPLPTQNAGIQGVYLLVRVPGEDRGVCDEDGPAQKPGTQTPEHSWHQNQNFLRTWRHSRTSGQHLVWVFEPALLVPLLDWAWGHGPKCPGPSSRNKERPSGPQLTSDQYETKTFINIYPDSQMMNHVMWWKRMTSQGACPEQIKLFRNGDVKYLNVEQAKMVMSPLKLGNCNRLVGPHLVGVATFFLSPLT